MGAEIVQRWSKGNLRAGAQHKAVKKDQATYLT